MDKKQINKDVGKKIGDLTLNEIFEICCEEPGCDHCPFSYKKHQENLPEREKGMQFCINFIDIFNLNILNKEVNTDE